MIKNSNSDSKSYIIGGGIAGLSAAAFLLTDANIKGRNIYIFDRDEKNGGSFDGQKTDNEAYICRGYRMFEKKIYLSTYDLLAKIPSITNPKKNLKDEFFEFNKKVKIHAKARLMEKGKILDSNRMQLNWRDRVNLINLLYFPEKYFGTTQIKEYFTPDFFKSNFWVAWCTTFAFEPWHSLVEMRRYIARFVHDAPTHNTMSCVLSAPYSEHDFFILPLVKWLKENGVNFIQNCKITDIEFEEHKNNKTAKTITIQKKKKEKIQLNKNDLVFFTNGSITADSSVGSMVKAPKISTKKSDSWALWKKLAKRFSDMGDPSVFLSSVNKTKWTSFTITFKDPTFFKLVEKMSGNKAGTGGIITFKDSNWLMSITLPYQPYFIGQPKNTFVCWGYGLMPDKIGNFVKKKMSDCNGKEILEELCQHIGFKKEATEIIKKAVCIPVMMPYITSQFMPRKVSDRPKVIPKGFKNFAFIGQYVEIPHEIVFTVECSIRSAKIAVNKLLNISNNIPPLYQKKYSAKCLYDAIKTILK